jgi:Ti-type conjugative transfer relaxase TraA
MSFSSFLVFPQTRRSRDASLSCFAAVLPAHPCAGVRPVRGDIQSPRKSIRPHPTCTPTEGGVTVSLSVESALIRRFATCGSGTRAAALEAQRNSGVGISTQDLSQGLNDVAIYHLHAQMVKRAEGESSVAGAAYRSGSRLYEESTGLTHDYTRKRGVEHSEILAPDGAPSWVHDRHTLWNTVEAAERRKDAQVAREIELGLPIELSNSEQLALVRDYVKREFVSKGMVADVGIHRDNPHNPHSHVLLTTRDLTKTGFGPKNRSWNSTQQLVQWRRGWAEVTNEHLMDAGLAVRIDHRSYKAQQLDLIPGRKIGLSQERQKTPDLPGFLADRVAEQQRIAGANGQQIIADPKIALKALSHSNATFSHHDIAKFLHTRTDNAEQFQTAYLKVTTSPELVSLGSDDLGLQRFTTREMFNLERSLLSNADALANRDKHAVDPKRRTRILAKHSLSPEQERAALEVTAKGDLKSLAGVAGSGKSTTLRAMREVWEAEGYTVKGAALAGIAQENLELSSGIKSRTLASYELAWNRGRDPLTRRDILVIDEAGMIDTRKLEHVLRVAEKAHAKVVLVGDAEQLQAIEAGAAFRGISATHGVSNLTEVRRQKTDWQRSATQELATAKTTDALNAYHQHSAIIAVEQRQDARNALIARWAHDHQHDPNASQLALAYTRADVHALNTDIRTLRQQTGQLGEGAMIQTDHGKKPFALNDRIRFLRNERDLGVKNGSLGIVEGIESGVLQVKLDGTDTRVHVDTKFYQHLDYGYAATVHKAQGTTVDKTYVLATSHFDRHTAYVALSRHRDDATVFYATEDFDGRSRGRRPNATPEEVHARFTETLSRARPKELAHDYLEREPTPDSPLVSTLVVAEWEKTKNTDHALTAKPAPSPANELDARQQAAAERWVARQRHAPPAGQGTQPSKTHAPSQFPERTLDRPPELRRDGPEDDLEL